MTKEKQLLINSKANEIAIALSGMVEHHIESEIIANVINQINLDPGMIVYCSNNIDRCLRNIMFETTEPSFDKLFNLLKENNHNEDNQSLGENEASWYCEKEIGNKKIMKVIVISNSQGELSFIYIKKEHFIEEEDYSEYWILRIYDDPEDYIKEHSRKTLRTLIRDDKLDFFNRNYADGKEKWSYRQFKSADFEVSHKFDCSTESILTYSKRNNDYSIKKYYSPISFLEVALVFLETAYNTRK